MKSLPLLMSVACLAVGCYRSHGYGDDLDLGVALPDTDVVHPGRVEVAVMTQRSPLPPEPLAGASVIVEDCATGEQAEARTNAQGLATFPAGEWACWTVTAFTNGEARSVVRGPVPLPGPIVFPQSTPVATSDTRVGWEVRAVGGGSPRAWNLLVTLPGMHPGTGSEGNDAGTMWGHTYDPVEWAGQVGIAIQVRSPEVLTGGMFTLPPPVAGYVRAEVRLPLNPPPPQEVPIRVHLPREGAYDLTSGRPAFHPQVQHTSPVGTDYFVGWNIEQGVTLVPTPAGVEVRGTFQWVNVAGTEAWPTPQAGGSDERFEDSSSDACSTPRVTWDRVPLVAGPAIETEIPPVEVRQVSGTTLDSLVVDVGGPGHRGHVSLRTAGASPLRWTIEPFETGVFHLETLPGLPAGVAERHGLSTASVHVQVGVTAPRRATFVAPDPSDRSITWWVRDGFVLGSLADFGLTDADCVALP
ncbi:MAG: hypothetical protein KBB95_10570 [Deltaproteobacteria bacterium]|nr:hypothetical protein [Deltaproteobacteria bacterium]